METVGYAAGESLAKKREACGIWVPPLRICNRPAGFLKRQSDKLTSRIYEPDE